MPTQVISAFKDRLPFTPVVVIEPNLKHDLDDLLKPLLHGQKIAIIDDRNTAQAYGDHVHKALQSAFACTHITFDAPPAADDEAASYIAERSNSCDVLVAVGTGTINDLCKHVSHAAGKSYVVIPTAASMNGYLSANASIIIQGYKRTIPAHMPMAVLCDMGIIAEAPARLNKCGMGDSLARSTAQADWLLSHLALGTSYDESVYVPLLAIEDELFASARGIAKSDTASLTLLIRTLLISGLGMTVTKGSCPASQGEHMIAHTYAMLKAAAPLPRTLHGEEIGVTTLAMARIQRALLKKKPVIRRDDFNISQLSPLFDNKVISEAQKSFVKKKTHLTQPEITHWGAVQEKIEKIMIPAARLQKVLEDMEAPTRPEMLGWKQDCYVHAITYARFLRDRFTFLDLE